MWKAIASMCWLVFLSAAASAADLAGPAGRASGSCAAIAISLEVKDAWGAQSLKDTCQAAENDALHVCEAILRKYGFQNGRCTVRSSYEWIVGVYCRDDVTGRGMAGIGVGPTPAAAGDDALRYVGGALGSRCWSPAIRHGSIRKQEFVTATWSIRTSCGMAREAGTEKGFNAMSSAIRQCGRRQLASCKLYEAVYH